MNDATASPQKRSPIFAVIVIVLVAGTLWLGISNLPRGYSRDLSQVGKGKNVAVLVHDHNLMGSVELMESLNTVRPEYAATVEFIVADLTTPEAQAFAIKHDVGSATLVFFAPDGAQRGTLKGTQDAAAFRNQLNQAFGLPARSQ